jgi:hypothetical protein
LVESGDDRQLPLGDEIFLDHVGHFVRDAQAASAALTRYGFAPTPVSVQANPDGTPVGTGNVTVMFRRGYIEVLFKTSETPLAAELDSALAVRGGVHLAAFSVADAERAHMQLIGAGLELRALVRFQRPVETLEGPDIAAFTVVRLERGAMPEGRIQMLQHRTERTVWQPHWLTHPNGATALVDMVVVAEDVDEAAFRFARFTSRRDMRSRHGRVIRLDRGQVQFMSGAAFAKLVADVPLPELPFVGAYAVKVRSLDAVESLLQQSGVAGRRTGAMLAAPFPDELGVGAWVFVESDADLPWRS